MKRMFFMLSGIALALGCGQGHDSIAHLGQCDQYRSPGDSPYILPWESGIARTISQGNCSSASHYGAARYAYDIPMDIGSTLVAVRDGVVTFVKEDENDGNGCPHANTVRIRHDDGTEAEYLHLTKDGAMVSLGDEVKQGQSIARSGNTGCSTGAHLHFQIWRGNDRKHTIPVTFRNTEGNQSRGLLAGETYKAN